MKVEVRFTCGHTREFVLPSDPTRAKERARELIDRAQREACPDCLAGKDDSAQCGEND